jgi:AraC-like DNA-binding protein
MTRAGRVAPELTPTVRAASLTNYDEVARFVGIQPDAMLKRAGLDRTLLSDPDTRIPAREVVRLFADSAARSGCASFGLLMAECRTLALLGPASLLLRHQPTIRTLIEAAIRVQRHFSDVVNLSLEDDGETGALRWVFLPEFDEPQWVEYSVAIGIRLFSEATHGHCYPEAVGFTHLGPQDSAAHKRILQCRVEFDGGFTGLTFASGALDMPNVLANPALAAHAERLLGLIPVEQLESSTVERARHAIFLLIHSSAATVERVGEGLGMHPRALQRLLGKEGWTFARLLNETRRELAERYLAGTHHSLATISNLAGYSSQSAFTRWFTAEFGRTPAAWRAHAHGHVSTAIS